MITITISSIVNSCYNGWTLHSATMRALFPLFKRHRITPKDEMACGTSQDDCEDNKAIVVHSQQHQDVCRTKLDAKDSRPDGLLFPSWDEILRSKNGGFASAD